MAKKKSQTTKTELTDEDKRKRIEDAVYGKVRNYFGKPILLFGVIAFEDGDKKPVIALAKGDFGYVPEALGITFAQMFPRPEADDLLKMVVQEIVWQISLQRGDIVMGEDGNYYIPLTQDVPEEEELPDDMRRALEVLRTGGSDEEEDESGGEVSDEG